MKGTILDKRYELIEVIGQGGFATVWLVHDAKLDREVALKLLDPLLGNREPQLLDEFIHEAKLVGRLAHANIVHIYDAVIEGSQPGLVMEYLPGGDLQRRLREHGPYSLHEGLQILSPIANGLDEAHRQKLIHRDVKPQNIIFARDGRPVLTDFGLVKVLSESHTVRAAVDSSGKFLGTPEYMAPEQIQGRIVSPKTDVYALAVIMYQLLTGSTPFRGETPVSTTHQVVYAARSELEANLDSDLPSACRQTLLKALAIDPTERPDSAGELIRQLQESLYGVAEVRKIFYYSQYDSEGDFSKAPDRQDYQLPAVHPGQSPLNINWCLIPEGKFIMGRELDFWDIFLEIPVIRPGFVASTHVNHLSTYWIARTPITNAQYRLFVQDGGYAERYWWTAEGWLWREEQRVIKPLLWSDTTWTQDKQPVVGVSWYEASAFTNWATHKTSESISLPTEAEWEKAARGPGGNSYPWGETAPNNKCAVFSYLGVFGPTHSLDVSDDRGLSPYGCADMAGNIWEWCSSLYKEYPYDLHDGREDAGDKGKRVVRGGAWNNVLFRDLNAASRRYLQPTTRNNVTGFRCVLRIAPVNQ